MSWRLCSAPLDAWVVRGAGLRDDPGRGPAHGGGARSPRPGGPITGLPRAAGRSRSGTPGWSRRSSSSCGFAPRRWRCRCCSGRGAATAPQARQASPRSCWPCWWPPWAAGWCTASAMPPSMGSPWSWRAARGRPGCPPARCCPGLRPPRTGKRGRPAHKGRRLGTCEQAARSAAWQTVIINAYGQTTAVQAATVEALWHGSFKTAPGRVVLVRAPAACPTGLLFSG